MEVARCNVMEVDVDVAWMALYKIFTIFPTLPHLSNKDWLVSNIMYKKAKKKKLLKKVCATVKMHNKNKNYKWAKANTHKSDNGQHKSLDRTNEAYKTAYFTCSYN